ncbi:ribosome silencing factor [Empedobacter stercoris]|uniref:Ribosomal silencing factor RsfS n=1 Tax=Empedobacter stercoris TaxID=1628248 RepID=A0ABX1WMW2_9FLAO|nr:MULTISPECIES: ribosome silencing factor [Empedobacter]HJD87308.1 ribosome silencing factor [Empedobacter falsenii]MCA4777113.1 ribosome silencing factor [Empedobacter stercoris]MCA4780813.1 ribosome silencing factor [Empedobacter stercoris]MCA4809684.1 ribosome silencing factor [Empedobacter stercoris]MDM1522156.1 ribosome silencing factor [Empedobacter sp. 225-1]
MIDTQYTKDLLDSIVDGITNVKGEEITILDLREIENAICQYFVICTGNSNTQVSAITGSIERTVKSEMSERPFHVEGRQNNQWVLMDYTNVIVHVFQKEYREYYDIESLWGDAVETRIEMEY